MSQSVTVDLGKISKHFSWKEALYLPRYKRMAEDSDGLTMQIRANLCELFVKMDKVREFFGKPITVTVCYRSPEYNKLIGGAKNSAHMQGMAVDFVVKDMKCDDVRKQLLDANKLEEWGLRMEDLPGSNWTHIDIRTPGPGGRFFKP